MDNQHLAQWPAYGEVAPPFKATSAQYGKWYYDLNKQFDASGRSRLEWPAFYARAKAEAMVKPPKNLYAPRKRGLFGGAHTPEYQKWRYRLLKAHKQAWVNGSDISWEEFFSIERHFEMCRQGLASTVDPTLLTAHNHLWVVASAPDPSTLPAAGASSKLFGGAHTKEYRDWYRKLRKLARSGKGVANWKSYFERAKWVEMERQGLLKPAHASNSTTAAIRTTASTTAPIPTSTSFQAADQGERLMWTEPEEEEGWV